MTDDELRIRNESSFKECYHPFADKIKAVIADLTAHGYRVRIQEAYRSPEDQMRAYNTGHSKLTFSFHNITLADGTPQACAVDLLDDADPNANATPFFLMLASSARAHGLSTGVLWGLTDNGRGIVNAAIQQKSWGSKVRIGWDAGHVEYPDTYPLAMQRKIRADKEEA